MPRGVGRPLWGLGEGARYLSHTFAGRVSKFFSKYSPGAAARLSAPPGALQAARGDKRDPAARRERGRGDPMETRVEAAGPISITLPFPCTPTKLIFGVFWSFLPCCHLRSFPRVAPSRMPCPGRTRRAEDLFSYSNPNLGIPTPKRPGRKGCVGTASGCPQAPSALGGHQARHPLPSEFPSWSQTRAGGRRQSLGGIWGEGSPPRQAWEPSKIISPAINGICTRAPPPHSPWFHYKKGSAWDISPPSRFYSEIKDKLVAGLWDFFL